MKVLHFTHSGDLDGWGAGILSRAFFGKYNIQMSYCNYNNINEKVKEYYNSFSEYELILITDISVNEQVAEMIESSGYSDRFVLLDHHETALFLNKYDWAKVIVENDKGNKECGTSLLCRWIHDHYVSSVNVNMFRFANLVRLYDTWEWKTKPSLDGEIAKDLNDLFYLIPRARFTARFEDYITNNLPLLFTDSHIEMLEINKLKIEEYIKIKSKYMKEYKIDVDDRTYNIGVLFAECHTSEMGNRLAEENPHLDAIAIINVGFGVSLRSVKEDVSLPVVAKTIEETINALYIEGNRTTSGGHKSASGVTFGESVKDTLCGHLGFYN